MFNPNVVIKNIVNQPTLHSLLLVVARILIAMIFIMAGWGKISDYAATAGYMESMGVPAALLPLTILVEFGGGLAILFGFQARLAAFGLAVFSIVTGFIFHGSNDPMQQIHFMKNLAMAGGLLYIMLYGAGRISIDHAIEK